ncbi:hypothetical protein T265_15605, partial [Opisthorchis viverrini]
MVSERTIAIGRAAYYNPRNPRVRFHQVEAVLATRHTTSQATRFSYIVQHLPCDVATEVEDLLEDIPKENPYDALRAAVISLARTLLRIDCASFAGAILPENGPQIISLFSLRRLSTRDAAAVFIAASESCMTLPQAMGPGMDIARYRFSEAVSCIGDTPFRNAKQCWFFGRWINAQYH